MTDFEDRLTTALRSAGDHAPDPAGLAPAARRRARVRRRRTALTSVAAVVAVAGVVGGTALLGNRGGSNDGSPPAADATTTSPSESSSPAARTEAWRDLQVSVPLEWGYGHLSTWCLNGKTEPGRPVVERPGGVVESIGCRGPQNGYGVQFLDGALADLAYSPGHVWQFEKGDGEAAYPEGAWLGYQRAGDNLALVITQSQALTEQVLGSFARLGGSDPDSNGCLPHPPTKPTLVPPGQLRLCRYGIDDWLEQSELLTGQDAADAVAALEAAPAKGDRMCTMSLTGPVVLVSSAEAQGRVSLDACQGLTWDGVDHDLTAEVLYWVLSPGWSGGVEGDVPMPAKLRG